MNTNCQLFIFSYSSQFNLLCSVARHSDHLRCQTETFKIVRTDKWKLSYNGCEHQFDHLTDLAQFIQTDNMDHIRIPASKYDKPPLLLLCLPKNLKTKKTEAKLSEAELLRRNPQIFNPKTDLQWYKGKECFARNNYVLFIYMFIHIL